MKKVVGIYGGTFDPPHFGHLSIVESFLTSTLLDEVWVIPALESPHKVNAVCTSFEHRLKMCEIAFAEMRNVVIKDIESTLPKPSFTYQTIQHLHSVYTDIEWVLCLGLDSLYSFSNWYKWELIIQEVSLLAAERKGIPRKPLGEKIRAVTKFVESHEAVDFSSSKIRNKLINRSGDLNYTEELHNLGLAKDIFDYIQTHGLYQPS